MRKMIGQDIKDYLIQTNLGANGEGIGRIDGYTLFVRGAIPGDKIRVKIIKTKKKYGYGIVADIIEPSNDRISPICPVANKCGGCSLQHMSYEGQLKYKESLIKESLIRIGEIDEALIEEISEPIIRANNPYYYRNKVQFPVRDNNGRIEIGFYAKSSHRIVETPRCYIQDTYNEEIIATIKKFMIDNQITAYNEFKHSGLIRHILIRKGATRDKFHVTIVINGKKLQKIKLLTENLMKLTKVEAFSLNVNQEKTNVVLGKQMINIEGPTYLIDNIKDISYQISPLSFYQVNPAQTVKLYDKVLEYTGLTGTETVYDLYCGIGTISLFLAKSAKEVHGVEIIDQAINDARENAKLNNIKNAFFYIGKSEEVMPELYVKKGIKADVVVVDPPRKGCDETLLKAMIEMAPKTIVYVSCDPGTLARDVKYLCGQGYILDKVCGCDMFCHSTHVETVVRLCLKESAK